ncbi:MAG: ATP-binding cassette domain-containing protein [Ruminococcaceae bacterium]|nr:ATP-binding cassette domain-containing protein [Oscillospiraceae bacterium]
MSVIEVRNVVKKWGSNTVLDSVDLTAERSEIIGIIGHNGSGKTVLMKCICGFITPDSGEITVSGKRLGKDIDIPRNIGLIIETPGFLPNFSGLSNLWQLAKIRGKISKDDVRAVIKKVGLDPADKKHVGKYSLGMRQRLGIAQAIMEDPDVLILDEPMNGLDKNGVRDMRELLLQLRDAGKTMIVASHNSVDIDVLCDRVFEITKGDLKRVR